MRTSDLDYHLPAELIAQQPSAERGASRLLLIDRSPPRFEDRQFSDLPRFLRPDDVLVVNNTRVLPARFTLRRASGGRIEGLWLQCDPSGHWEVLLRGAARVRIGETLAFEGQEQITAILLHRGPRGAHTLRVAPDPDPQRVLERVGTLPLPHYIRRAPTAEDENRYQTVYARAAGAVAAPTAGLHFDDGMIERLCRSGVTLVEVTLHTGPGTFQPVETETLEAHGMHRERYQVAPAAWDLIAEARRAGRRFVAVGTTSVRALESICRSQALEGWTDLFIQPPFEFKMVDALLTNFHLPRSTLLALVYAFGGRETIRQAYDHAVANRYRFYSYGDAMLIR